jgi:glutaminyl-peptide cyclotransferase
VRLIFVGWLFANTVWPSACNGGGSSAHTRAQSALYSGTTKTEPVQLVAMYPHDTSAFTQGLIVRDGVFEESTGQYGHSTLRRVELDSGRPLANIALPNEFFGEGLALLKGELFQLTWREHLCRVYDATTLEKRRELSYEGEGWGLTTDGTSLIMSDGSATLTYRDPHTFVVEKKVEVTDRGTPIMRLNELEWINGSVWANIWQTDVIARIDPGAGSVLGYIDLAALPEPQRRVDRDNVLNGIAFDSATGKVFVTGKRWSRLFEIALPHS